MSSNRMFASVRRATPAVLAAWIGLFVIGAPAVLAQEQGEALCGNCKTSGKVAEEIPASYKDEYDSGEGWEVLFCADAIDAGHKGTDWRPCPRCKTPSVHAVALAEWEQIVARDLDWLKERRRVDELTGVKEMAHVESTHFVIAWDLPKISTADKKSYRKHAAAHLYIRRFEEFYARYQEVLDVVDADNMQNKHYIYMFERSHQAEKASTVYAGMTGHGTQRRMGGAETLSTLVLWNNKSEHPSDAALHRHFVHNLTHQTTAVYYNPNWLQPGETPLAPLWLNDKYGWLDAGLAHWFEMDLDDEATTFCFQEQDTRARWKGSDWHKNVWKAVNSGDIPSFANLITKPTPALSAREHQFVWSWVDFLVERDGAAMGKAVKLAKSETATRDILKQCWGLTTIGLEQAWLEWVMIEYDPQRSRG